MASSSSQASFPETTHGSPDSLSSFDSATPAEDTFQSLVRKLSQALGSSGLDSNDLVQSIMTIMKDSREDSKDFNQYFLPNPKLNYTRNLVDDGNGKYNLLILVWTPRKGSPIHDHAGADCMMKVLSGKLKETRYRHAAEGEKLEVIGETVYKEGEVSFMSDNLGLHKVGNPDDQDYAVSLHRTFPHSKAEVEEVLMYIVYTPPTAAEVGCNIFDEETGKKSHINISDYYSVKGKRSIKYLQSTEPKSS